MSTITWLHLSDFHFRESDIYNTEIVLNDLLKDMESSGEAPKDDVARALKKIQEMTDQGVEDADKIVTTKEAEITEI